MSAIARRATTAERLAASKTDDIREAPDPDLVTLPDTLATDGTRRWDTPMGQITRVLEEMRVESPHLNPAGREAIPPLIEALWLLSEGRAQLAIAGDF